MYLIWKTQGSKYFNSFELMIGGKFAALSPVETGIRKLVVAFKDDAQESVMQVIGRKKKKTQAWITEEILDLCNHMSAR